MESKKFWVRYQVNFGKKASEDLAIDADVLKDINEFVDKASGDYLLKVLDELAKEDAKYPKMGQIKNLYFKIKKQGDKHRYDSPRPKIDCGICKSGIVSVVVVDDAGIIRPITQPEAAIRVYSVMFPCKCCIGHWCNKNYDCFHYGEFTLKRWHKRTFKLPCDASELIIACKELHQKEYGHQMIVSSKTDKKEKPKETVQHIAELIDF